MTDKSAVAVREFAEKYMVGTPYTLMYKNGKPYIVENNFISDLTALIEEHYVSKDKYMDDLVDEYERGFRDGRGDVNNNDR